MADPHGAHRWNRFPLAPAPPDLAATTLKPLPVNLGDGRAGVRWQRCPGVLPEVSPPSWPHGHSPQHSHLS